jgi:hypothetical protein
MNKKSKVLPPVFLAIALIYANAGIIIAIMHLVFHFIDSVNFAVGFLDNKFTEIIMLVASVLSMFTSVFVLLILQRRESKSYFFRKIAFITFWVCAFNILFQKNVIYPNVLEDFQKQALWFLVSMFTLFNSVFCNGLLAMNTAYSDSEQKTDKLVEDTENKETIDSVLEQNQITE